MELNVLKHSHEDSLSNDVYRFLQKDHNLLSQFGTEHFNCEICSKVFSEENDLHYHRLDHMIDKPLFICDDPVEEQTAEKDPPPEHDEECQKYEKPFTCERCRKHFSTMSCLKIHQKLFHFEYSPTSSCDHCGNHYKWKHHLAVHKYPESSDKSLSCNTCSIDSREEFCASDKCDDESSIQKKHVNIPDLSHTFQKSDDAPISKKHVCHFCQKEFALKGDLSRHILIHTVGEQSYVCKYCGKIFSQKIHLNTHIEIHTKKTAFICDICQKGFTHEGFLNRHLRLHSEGKLFVCKVCHKTLSDNTTLEHHLSIHYDENSFICNICFKSFELQKDLVFHLQIHSEEKLYPCDFCERKFIRKRCLATHIMRLHSDQRPA